MLPAPLLPQMKFLMVHLAGWVAKSCEVTKIAGKFGAQIARNRISEVLTFKTFP